MSHLSRSYGRILLRTTLLIAASLALASSALSQTARKRASGPAEETPIFNEYRGVQIGSLTDDVRKKLGSPANKSDEQDFFTFGEKETAQILYDKEHKVVTISVDFSNGATGILTPQQVFGADVPASSDGSRNKLVRYTKVGYWVCYNRTAGDTPIVSVTIQKIP